MMGASSPLVRGTCYWLTRKLFYRCGIRLEKTRLDTYRLYQSPSIGPRALHNRRIGLDLIIGPLSLHDELACSAKGRLSWAFFSRHHCEEFSRWTGLTTRTTHL